MVRRNTLKGKTRDKTEMTKKTKKTILVRLKTSKIFKEKTMDWVNNIEQKPLDEVKIKKRQKTKLSPFLFFTHIIMM